MTTFRFLEDKINSFVLFGLTTGCLAKFHCVFDRNSKNTIKYVVPHTPPGVSDLYQIKTSSVV